MASASYADQLRRNGYVILPALDPVGLMDVYRQMRDTPYDDHPAKTSPLDMMNAFISKKTITATYGRPQQRESWFLSDRWSGPYGDLPRKFHEHVKATLATHFPNILQTGHSYASRPWAMGVHIYRVEGEPDAEGLHEHYDVDTVSALYSNRPLEALVNGEWVSVTIPEGSLMVFSGLVSFIARGVPPLLHRVRHCSEPKFSVGVFIGPDFEQPVVAGKAMTVGELYTQYFSERDASKILELAASLRS